MCGSQQYSTDPDAFEYFSIGLVNLSQRCKCLHYRSSKFSTSECNSPFFSEICTLQRKEGQIHGTFLH